MEEDYLLTLRDAYENNVETFIFPADVSRKDDIEQEEASFSDTQDMSVCVLKYITNKTGGEGIPRATIVPIGKRSLATEGKKEITTMWRKARRTYDDAKCLYTINDSIGKMGTHMGKKVGENARLLTSPISTFEAIQILKPRRRIEYKMMIDQVKMHTATH